MVILSTFVSIFFQMLLAYGANELSNKLHLTSGYELFILYWVFTAARYLYSINNYLEYIKIAEKELSDKFIAEIKKISTEEKKDV